MYERKTRPTMAKNISIKMSTMMETQPEETDGDDEHGRRTAARCVTRSAKIGRVRSDDDASRGEARRGNAGRLLPFLLLALPNRKS